MTSSFLRAGVLVSILAGSESGCVPGQAGGHSAVEPKSKPEEQQTDVDPIVKLLRSRSPGLLVTRTASGEIAVQLIKGPTSFYSGTAPLYVSTTYHSPGTLDDRTVIGALHLQKFFNMSELRPRRVTPGVGERPAR